MALDPKVDRDAVAGHHRDHHDHPAQEGPAQRVDARHAAARRPGHPRIVGPAFTLRFVPAREDLATPASWSNPISTRAAIEAMPAGCVAVVDAMGVTDAGIFGDILCARMEKRGVAALVTDGVVRDVAGVRGTGLPVWCQGAAAPPSVAGLTFVAWEPADRLRRRRGVPRRRGGRRRRRRGARFPRRSSTRSSPTRSSRSASRSGSWARSRTAPRCPGLYPPNAENLARYEKTKK